MTIAAVVHETRTRLRLRLTEDADPAGLRTALEQLRGVRHVRVARMARSVVVTHDGRGSTRADVLGLVRSAVPFAPRDEPPPRAGEALPLEASALAAALTPVLPEELRPAAALALVTARAIAAGRKGADLTATTLDAIALATTALTGHPLTATASVLLGSLAERRRNRLLRETDTLLAHLAPPTTAEFEVERDGEAVRKTFAALEVGDRIVLRPELVLPADGIVVRGQGSASAMTPEIRSFEAGHRLVAGARIAAGGGVLRVERPVELSRTARLHAHVRHALRTRDAPGPLTPDLERLLALPMTAAGLVLALTGDAARTAAMLQADPQMGFGLVQPVTREAALYAVARSGALLSGLDSIDRLASATTFAFEDVGVLTEPYWNIDRIDVDEHTDAHHVRHWLARLAGHAEPALLDAGLLDAQVAAWRENGALLREGERVMHIGGAALLARTWNLPLPEPDRRSLVRRLGVVEGGKLLATIYLGSRLRPDVAAQFERLRALGVRRIAVFSEDPAAQPAHALTRIGADVVVCESRSAQERWLDHAVEHGERVALVHTGLRDLLSPGGLSLCPVDAEAGAHGVLLGEPIESLLLARAVALRIRRALRWKFGRAVALNSALMIAAAMRWIPLWAAAAIKHGATFLLLEESARLADLQSGKSSSSSAPGALATMEAKTKETE